MTKQKHLERKLRSVERAAAMKFGMGCNPRIRFGRACVPGTRIDCSCIQGRFMAGDGMSHLSEEYGLSLEVVERAIRCGMWIDMQFYVCEECAEFG